MLYRLLHVLALLALPIVSWGATEKSDDGWLLMVRTLNTDALREAEFNKWYDEIDVPDVLKVPGFDRARRGRLVAAPRGASKHPEEGGRYVALYDIVSPAIDKTIIDMLMATWKMIAVGRDTSLLKVEERVYYQRLAPPFAPAGERLQAADTCLILERFDENISSGRGQLLSWYADAYRRSSRLLPGFVRATRYELYRVLMFEPTSAPRYLTIYEVSCSSTDEANRSGEKIARRHEQDGAGAGYVPVQTLTYRQVAEKRRAFPP